MSWNRKKTLTAERENRGCCSSNSRSSWSSCVKTHQSIAEYCWRSTHIEEAATCERARNRVRSPWGRKLQRGDIRNVTCHKSSKQLFHKSHFILAFNSLCRTDTLCFLHVSNPFLEACSLSFLSFLFSISDLKKISTQTAFTSSVLRGPFSHNQI